MWGSFLPQHNIEHSKNLKYTASFAIPDFPPCSSLCYHCINAGPGTELHVEQHSNATTRSRANGETTIGSRPLSIQITRTCPKFFHADASCHPAELLFFPPLQFRGFVTPRGRNNANCRDILNMMLTKEKLPTTDHEYSQEAFWDTHTAGSK